MTETLENTPPTNGQGFPDSIGFGFAEVVALLNLRKGEEATRSAAALRLEAELEDVTVISAGASSLVARGLATAMEGGELAVSGPVAAFTAALTSPAKRVQIDLLTAERIDNVLSVESDEFSILLQPRAYLSWFAMAQKPELSTAEANFYVIRKHLEDNPDGGAAVSLLTGEERIRLLIKREDGAWTVGTNNPDGTVVDESSGLSEAEVLERIRLIRQD